MPSYIDINLDTFGKQHGSIWVNDGTNESAEGMLSTPLAVIKNGDGPTVLLTGGIHGDEYVGQIALTKIIQTIQPENINGRLIIVPVCNVYASQAGTRFSPRDTKNMNSSFPGNPHGSLTERICDIIENVLMPKSDFVIDIHSGGRSLEYIPAPLVALSGDTELDRESIKLADIFGLQYTYIIEDAGNSCTAAAAHRQKKPFIGAEIGGGELACGNDISIATKGIFNILAAKGIVPEVTESTNKSKKLIFKQNAFLRVSSDGMYLPEHTLGAIVRKGDVSGKIFWPNEPNRLAEELYYPEDGVLICQRKINRVHKGDCILHLGICT